MLQRAHPGLRETTETLRILGRQARTIRRLIVDADTVVAALERRKRDVSRFVRESGRTADVAASRRAELARSTSCRPSWRSLTPTAEAQPARRCPGAGAPRPARRERRSSTPSSPCCPASPTRAGPRSAALGEASVVGRRAVRADDDDLGEGPTPPGRATCRPGEAPAPAARDDRRPQAGRGGRPARRRDHARARSYCHRAAGAAASRGWRRSGLLLLAGADDQRARRHRPRAAHRDHGRRRLLRLREQPRRGKASSR